jgi:very-short-patch-repair endonuclease
MRGLGGSCDAMLSYNKGLKEPSRRLRNNMTDAERLFWSEVRMRQLSGLQFYRQKTIGRYIVDFFCPRAKLVIEIDGSQHYQEEALERDKLRDDFLRAQGLKVLRFSNREVLENVAGVLETVCGEITLSSPFAKEGEEI